MVFFWLLRIAINCVDHFAWPLLALGYPLCASVQAIETDSHKKTRDLISYWILFSLLYLFEYAFLRLLQLFQFWPYFKLMIISWLIIPDFEQASYVYNNLIRSYHSVNSQAVICWLNNWRNFFVKKDNFLLHADRYIKENGTEALEKLIASKSTTYKSDAEATNAVRAVDNKEMQQTNEKKLRTEQKDIEDMEMIEKKEILAGKQDIPVMSNLAESQRNTSSATVKTEGKAGKGAADGEVPLSSTPREVQKEWTCALCEIKTTSEQALNDHLQGKKHKTTCEALKAKNQPVPQKQKSDQSKAEVKQKNIIYQLNSKTQKGESIVNNGLKEKVVMNHNVQELQKNPCPPVGTNNSKLRCEICNVTCPGEVAMISHLNGRKHLAKIKIFNLI